MTWIIHVSPDGTAIAAQSNCRCCAMQQREMKNWESWRRTEIMERERENHISGTTIETKMSMSCLLWRLHIYTSSLSPLCNRTLFSSFLSSLFSFFLFSAAATAATESTRHIYLVLFTLSLPFSAQLFFSLHFPRSFAIFARPADSRWDDRALCIIFI